MSNFIICARNIKGQGDAKQFGDEPGDISYVITDDNAMDFSPKDKVRNGVAWIEELTKDRDLKDVLIYLHGYNMDRDVTLERHKILKDKLKSKGWEGELVTFAWPSKKHTLLYWEDRLDGLNVATKLVTDCISLLNRQMQNGCKLNIHLIAHSTGALLVREGFKLAKIGIGEGVWAVGQVMFVAGDISSDSMMGDASKELYDHSGRITNYFSNYDSALMVSSAKRLGTANRVGRVGLPMASSDKAIDVNCSQHYINHKDELTPVMVNAEPSHSWYFWSDMFIQDIIHTMNGFYDRNVIPTRDKDLDGEFWLKV